MRSNVLTISTFVTRVACSRGARPTRVTRQRRRSILPFRAASRRTQPRSYVAEARRKGTKGAGIHKRQEKKTRRDDPATGDAPHMCGRLETTESEGREGKEKLFWPLCREEIETSERT